MYTHTVFIYRIYIYIYVLPIVMMYVVLTLVLILDCVMEGCFCWHCNTSYSNMNSIDQANNYVWSSLLWASELQNKISLIVSFLVWVIILLILSFPMRLLGIATANLLISERLAHSSWRCLSLRHSQCAQVWRRPWLKSGLFSRVRDRQIC